MAGYLTATIQNKGFVAKDMRAKRYNDQITLKFLIVNNSSHDIQAYKGYLVFNDLFGKKIMELTYQDDRDLKAGQKEVILLSYKFNQFIDSHVNFKNTELSNV